MSKRLSFDDYFLGIAQAVAARAACTRRQVGAVIVKDHRILATGYNGAPAGQVECTDGGCPRGRLSYDDLPTRTTYETGTLGECIAHHAEVNAIVRAGRDAIGATIYLTCAPCSWCAKVVEASGITAVVYPKEST